MSIHALFTQFCFLIRQSLSANGPQEESQFHPCWPSLGPFIMDMDLIFSNKLYIGYQMMANATAMIPSPTNDMAASKVAGCLPGQSPGSWHCQAMALLLSFKCHHEHNFSNHNSLNFSFEWHLGTLPHSTEVASLFSHSRESERQWWQPGNMAGAYYLPSLHATPTWTK